MKRKRRNHSAEFKARVAMEALKGIRPVHEIAAEFDVHPVQVSQWKKALQDNVSSVVERKNARADEREREQKHIERLERKLGQVVVERDWLAKKAKQLGIEE